jgi:hypothetical protein
MTDPNPDDDALWAEIEAEVAAEERAKTPRFASTEQLIAELGKHGLDASKFGLPARDWTVDEAHEALSKLGVTGESFKPPKPPTIEQRWYGKK